MGDRTSVDLYVPAELKDQAIEVIETSSYGFDDQGLYQVEGLYHFSFYEVNYGELPFLKQLAAAGIAFDSCWGSGDEYTAGEERLRFLPDGSTICKNYLDEDLVIAYSDLKELVKLPPEDLLKNILEIAQSLADKCEVPDWENQVEYGKRHRALQLINPQE
jgi:hypothetical protein